MWFWDCPGSELRPGPAPDRGLHQVHSPGLPLVDGHGCPNSGRRASGRLGETVGEVGVRNNRITEVSVDFYLRDCR